MLSTYKGDIIGLCCGLVVIRSGVKTGSIVHSTARSYLDALRSKHPRFQDFEIELALVCAIYLQNPTLGLPDLIDNVIISLSSIFPRTAKLEQSNISTPWSPSPDTSPEASGTISDDRAESEDDIAATPRRPKHTWQRPIEWPFERPMERPNRCNSSNSRPPAISSTLRKNDPSPFANYAAVYFGHHIHSTQS